MCSYYSVVYDMWHNHPMPLKLRYKCSQMNMAELLGCQKPNGNIVCLSLVSNFGGKNIFCININMKRNGI